MMTERRRASDVLINTIIDRMDDHSKRIDAYERTLALLTEAVNKSDERTQAILLQVKVIGDYFLSNGTELGIFERLRRVEGIASDVSKKIKEAPKNRRNIIATIAIVVNTAVACIAILT